jgi:hypothetical protein
LIEFNKQVCANILGIGIVIFHVAFSFWLWFYFNPGFNSNGQLFVAELSTPLSATFSLGVIKWVIDTQGKITSQATIGLPFAFLLAFVTICLFVALVYGPLVYRSDTGMQPATLNSYFLFVDSTLGGLFALFFNDMFGRQDDKAPAPPVGG